MKKSITVFTAVIAAFMAMSFAACSAPDRGFDGSENWSGGQVAGGGSMPDESEDDSGEWSGGFMHDSIVENGFTEVAKEPSSYFSMDRNTASYSQVRYQIEKGGKVFADSVRIEELINYFDYDFPAPEEGAVAVNTYLADCPWNAEHKLMLAGIKTAERKTDSVNGNYVFLVDVSGSMSGDDRLGLAKNGLKMLADNLGDGDIISLVTYANGVTTVLDGGECSQSGKETVKSAIDKLKAGGGTNGSDGLQRAYKIAEKHYITGGNNRVIIISDGDFNVGIYDKDTLQEMISERTVAEKKVYLSVFGVGMGNMRDDMLEMLAKSGNGNYAYLDNMTEAEKAFCHELDGTLVTVAKDAKAGVTFEENVAKYRLIGYDTKIISKDEFEDDTTDTGEIGSNLCVAALYEIELAANAEGKLATVEVKYKDVTGEAETDVSVKTEVFTSSPSSNDLSFIACVAEFGLVLRQSAYAENANLYAVLERLEGLSDYTAADPYRADFVTLAGKASEIYNQSQN